MRIDLVLQPIENLDSIQKKPELLSAQSQVIACLNGILELKSQENAYRPLNHKRRFYLILKSINEQNKIQKKLKAIYDYLLKLLDSHLNMDLKQDNKMLVLNWSASSENDEWLVFIEQHWWVLELWIVWKTEDNILLYQDLDWFYKIRKIWNVSYQDKANRIKGYLDEYLIRVGRSSKLYEIDAIPWLIRDIQKSNVRKKWLKIYRIASKEPINPHNIVSLIRLMDRAETPKPIWKDSETWFDIY